MSDAQPPDAPPADAAIVDASEPVPDEGAAATTTTNETATIILTPEEKTAATEAADAVASAERGADADARQQMRSEIRGKDLLADAAETSTSETTNHPIPHPSSAPTGGAAPTPRPSAPRIAPPTIVLPTYAPTAVAPPTVSSPAPLPLPSYAPTAAPVLRLPPDEPSPAPLPLPSYAPTADPSVPPSSSPLPTHAHHGSAIGFDDAFRIEITNEYGGQPASISRGMYDKIHAVVEPYRVSNLTLHISTPISEVVGWSIHDVTSDAVVYSAVTGGGAELAYRIAYTFTGITHEYAITARGLRSGLATTLIATCKYVRRELRTLTVDDRERYLAALATVYHTREADGKRRYGGSFTSGEWFTRWHLGESGIPTYNEMSPWHGAPSFFPAHAVSTVVSLFSLMPGPVIGVVFRLAPAGGV